LSFPGAGQPANAAKPVQKSEIQGEHPSKVTLADQPGVPPLIGV
jgi:hypothetical protein